MRTQWRERFYTAVGIVELKSPETASGEDNSNPPQMIGPTSSLASKQDLAATCPELCGIHLVLDSSVFGPKSAQNTVK